MINEVRTRIYRDLRYLTDGGTFSINLNHIFFPDNKIKEVSSILGIEIGKCSVCGSSISSKDVRILKVKDNRKIVVCDNTRCIWEFARNKEGY